MPVTVSVIPEPAAGAPYFNEAYGVSRYIDVTVPTYSFTADGDVHIVVVNCLYFEYPYGQSVNGFYSYIGGSGSPPKRGHSCAIPMSAVTAYETYQSPNYENTEIIFSEWIAGGYTYKTYIDPGSAYYPAWPNLGDLQGFAVDRWEIISRPKSGTTYRVLLDMSSFASTMIPDIYGTSSWMTDGSVTFDQNISGHACVFLVSGVDYKSLTEANFTNPEWVPFTESHHKIGNFISSGYLEDSTDFQGFEFFHSSQNGVTKGVGATKTLLANHNGYVNSDGVFEQLQDGGAGGQILTASVVAGPLTANPTFSTGETNTSGFLSTKSSLYSPATLVSADGTVGAMPFHVSFSTKPASSTGQTTISRTRPSWGPFTQGRGDNNLVDSVAIRISALYVKPFTGKTSFSGKRINGQPIVGAGFLAHTVLPTYIAPKTLDAKQSEFYVIRPEYSTTPNPDYASTYTTSAYQAPLRTATLTSNNGQEKTSYIVKKRITDMIPETMYSYWN